MNIRCPNCGAVFPPGRDADAGGDVECPLCLVSFAPDAAGTVSTANDSLPPSVDELGTGPLDSGDEFETFGSSSGLDTVTLGSSAPNPFADPAAADPFGGTSSFGQDAGDPFAVGGAAADPFAADGPAAPFGDAGDSAADGGGDVDFGALLGALDDGVDHGADTQMVDREQASALLGGGDDSLFGGDEGGGQDGDSLFLATANTSGAVFDAEDDDDDDYDSYDDPARAPGIEPLAPRKSEGDEEASRSKPRPGPRIAMLLLVLLGGGIAMDYMGMPAFGLGSLGDEQIEHAPSADARPVAKNLISETRLDDTKNKYLLEISRLEQVAASLPTDMEVKRRHLDRLLDLYERFPDEFSAEPRLGAQIDAYKETIKPFPKRFKTLEKVANGNLDKLEPRLIALATGDGATADDVSAALAGVLDIWRRKLLRQALNNPGLISRAEIDPMRLDGSGDPLLKKARAWLDRVAPAAAKQQNHMKFAWYDARLRDLMGDFASNVSKLPKLLGDYPDQNELRLVLASAMIETNHLGQAAKHLKEATGRAQTGKHMREMVGAWHLEARLAARRGRRDDQIVALQSAIELNPSDELSRIRLARLLLDAKRSQECQQVLIDGKKKNMSSVAFEVALVEYWLWANREEDALAETVAATKKYPDSVDLLFLRGQVEEQQQHHATARDYFAQVIAREPRHLRAVLRLSELQSRAGRHDDALITLQNARERLGDEPAILERMARALQTLDRLPESRKLYAILLKKRPSNREYLLNAARLDLVAGRTDRALGYLRALRDDSALDREGAMQLALALASKGKPGEAAATLLPFAEKEPTNMRLNTLTGKYLLDSDDIDRAVTFLKRAYAVAHRQGGDPETLFQYGRLAFRQGDVSEGSNRMQLAIKGDSRAHRYRFDLARFLLKADPEKHETAHKVAVEQLRYLILHAERLAESNNPIKYLDDVHRHLAHHYVHKQRFEKALPHLRRTLELRADDMESRVKLGTALFQVNHADAEMVLKQVIRQRPNDAQAALYLGLISLTKNQSSDALRWFNRAVESANPKVAEAHYQLALIHRDRKQLNTARRHLRLFLKRAPEEHPFRQDADGLMKALKGG